ncbi:hypothetical protein EJ02DRAFT_34994 [Clathrospora elynae]|uniref:Uncharacterized protein n=1 Tax=Clathrospora elynae TaxID=706981 RepID=A0A6A5T069_9PLEO|nr:hypothetical protein EJ02DRAFT_34994 [Clathrospora elynae]
MSLHFGRRCCGLTAYSLFTYFSRTHADPETPSISGRSSTMVAKLENRRWHKLAVRKGAVRLEAKPPLQNPSAVSPIWQSIQTKLDCIIWSRCRLLDLAECICTRKKVPEPSSKSSAILPRCQ